MECEITSKLDEIILTLSNGLILKEELNDSIDLIVDCGFDSLSIIECIVEIEQQFNIEFDEDCIMIENIQSYAWLKQYIESKLYNER